MINKIINTCQKFNSAIEHRGNPTDEEMDILQYFNIELAKSIIHDIDSNNAKQVAKIILDVVN